MILRIGKRPDPRLSSRGFTLIELLLALSVVATTLVFLLGSLSNLSRFISQSAVQTEALALAGEKILEWEMKLDYGEQPTGGSQSGVSETNPDLEWRAKTFQTETEDSLYESDVEGYKRGRPKPVAVLAAQGRPREEQTESEGAQP